MAERDDVRTSTVALVGLIGALVVFGLIVLLEVVYYRVIERQLFVKQINQPWAELSENQTRQEARLNEPPGWQDQKKGAVHIPIELAMDLVVKDYARGRVDPPPKPEPVAKPADKEAAPKPADKAAGGKEKDHENK